MAAISHVFTIGRAAQILGRDEDLLWELSDPLEPEVCSQRGLVLRRVYSGDLLFQFTFKRGFKDSNLVRQSRWFELRVALLTMRRGFDRFCPKFPDLLFRDACLLSIHTKTNRG